MREGKQDLYLFVLRFAVLLPALFLIDLNHRFSPVPSWVNLLFLLYGFAGTAVLLQSQRFALPFLVLDVLWVFFFCVLGKSWLFSWLFVLPLVSAAREKNYAKLGVVLVLVLALLFLLQGYPFPHFKPLGWRFFFFGVWVLLMTAWISFYAAKGVVWLSSTESPEILKLKEEYHEKMSNLVDERSSASELLYEKLRQHAVLYEIISHITRTLDMNEILELTVRRTKEELRAEKGFLMLVEEGMLAVRYSDGLTEIAKEAFQSRLGERPFGDLVLSGEVLQVFSQDSDHPVLNSLLSTKAMERIRDLLVVPLKSPARGLPAMGVLGVANSLEAQGFSQDHLEMMTILAGQSAIAMDNAESVQRIKNFFKETIGALAAAINQKHTYTHVLHSKSVAKWAVDIARELALPEGEIERIEIAGLLHDVGKIAIPDEVLTKPGKLTPEEMEVMKQHPDKGVRILQSISMIRDILPFIRYHHERWDGRGYPDSLAENAIPLGAQIVSLADSFDAMTSNRPYHPGLSRQAALSQITAESGKQFSPKVVEAFQRVMAKHERSPIKTNP